MRNKINKIYTNLVTAGFKNSKLLYYLKNYVRLKLPSVIYQRQLDRKLRSLGCFNEEYINQRVNYYNKIESDFSPSINAIRLDKLKLNIKGKTYVFDTREYTRYFPESNKLNFEFGDVTYIPEVPSIVKSRPIAGENANSVVLKLDKVRHFTFVKDRKDFLTKKDMIVWRGAFKKVHTHRIEFLKKYFGHPLCDVGHVSNLEPYLNWKVDRMNMCEQLNYKFIMCIEGYDVSTSLKWVMSSKSLAVSPKPVYETWFMEGTLIPDYHYVLVKDDYSDLIEKMEYYIQHPDKAKAIIKNANDYIAQFKNKKREDLISLLVLQKYFTKQINSIG